MIRKGSALKILRKHFDILANICPQAQESEKFFSIEKYFFAQQDNPCIESFSIFMGIFMFLLRTFLFSFYRKIRVFIETQQSKQVQQSLYNLPRCLKSG